MSAVRVHKPEKPDSSRASDHPLEIDREQLAAGIDWGQIFGNKNPVELEIGCGKGLFLSTVAAAHPDVNWLGLERSAEHLRRAIDRAAKAGLKNVRFVRAAAEDLLSSWAPTASVRAVHILYPDPWPKGRHHKRRLLGLEKGPTSVRQLARVILPGGHLSIASDHTEYAEIIEEVVSNSPDFERESEMYSVTLLPDREAPLTEFERKYRAEGRPRHRMSWRRR